MSIDSLLATIQEKAASAAPLGNTLKFDLGDHQFFIDGTGGKNLVTIDDSRADCLIEVNPENFQALMSGNLNPMTAAMMGKIKIKGDMSVAMKLQSMMG